MGTLGCSHSNVWSNPTLYYSIYRYIFIDASVMFKYFDKLSIQIINIISRYMTLLLFMRLPWTRNNFAEFLHGVQISTICAIFSWFPTVLLAYLQSIITGKDQKIKRSNPKSTTSFTMDRTMSSATYSVINNLNIEHDIIRTACSLISQSWMAIVLDVYMILVDTVTKGRRVLLLMTFAKYRFY